MQLVHGDVVVDEHVGAGTQHPLQPPHERGQPGLCAELLGGDEHGLADKDRIPEGLQASGPQRRAGLDDVGDEVGHAQLDGGLHSAVEVNGLGIHTSSSQVAAHQDVIGGGHPAPGDVGQGAHGPLGSGEAEGGAGEAQGQVLDGVDPGVQEQVAAGDAGVDGALADIDGDVAWP